MADIELNLSSANACNGDRGVYKGVLYFHDGSRGLARQFDLDEPHYSTADPGGLIHESRAIVRSEFGIEIEPHQLIALAVSRICIRKRHDDGVAHTEESNEKDNIRLERVASLAITNDDRIVERIRPLNAEERSITPHGIGYARRLSPGLAPIRPLIHLPVTPNEMLKYPVIGVIKSLAIDRVISRQPYIALHGPEQRTIEQIVTPKQL